MFCGLKILSGKSKILLTFFSSPKFDTFNAGEKGKKSNLDLSDLSLSVSHTPASSCHLFWLFSWIYAVSPYSVTVHSSTTSTNLASFGQYANLFLPRWYLTSLSLNIASNHQLYLIWSLISTPLPDPSLSCIGLQVTDFLLPLWTYFTDFVTGFCSLCLAILEFSWFFPKPLFFYVTNLPVKSHSFLYGFITTQRW